MRWSVVLVVALLISGCGDDDEPVAAGGASTGIVVGGEYVATEVTEAGEVRPLVDGTRIDLRFDERELGATAGCNHLGGEYSLDGDTLVVGPMGGTEMGCAPELHDQDQWLTTFLTSSPTVASTEEGFDLTSGSTTVRFVDRQIAVPDAELVGLTWTVTGFIDGDTAMSTTAATEQAWVRFDEDGTVQVDDGCNGSTWDYSVDGTTLAFESRGGTLVACPDEHHRVLAPFEAGSVTVEVDGRAMTLVTGDGKGVTFATTP